LADSLVDKDQSDRGAQKYVHTGALTDHNRSDTMLACRPGTRSPPRRL